MSIGYATRVARTFTSTTMWWSAGSEHTPAATASSAVKDARQRRRKASFLGPGRSHGVDRAGQWKMLRGHEEVVIRRADRVKVHAERGERHLGDEIRAHERDPVAREA